MSSWNENLGKFNAIVSTNSLFHVLPDSLYEFYKTCFELILNDGFILNFQSFAWNNDINLYSSNKPFEKFMRGLPKSILPQLPSQTDEEKKQLTEKGKIIHEQTKKAIEDAKNAGVEFDENQTGYQFLTVEHHLESMKKAGFNSGCIWRKREFAVICGIKEN